MTIGQTILKLRQDEKLTQKSLSLLCGLSERFINYIEHDKKTPSWKSLCKIAKAVDKTLDSHYNPGTEETFVKFTLRNAVRKQDFDNRIAALKNQLYYDCLKLCGYNKSAAQDLSQETMFQAILYHYRYNESCQLYTWVFSIAKNIYYAEKKRNKNLDLVEQYFEGLVDEKEVESFYKNTSLVSYLNKLSPKRKQLYKLRLLNLPYSDIANQMGLDHNYVKSRFWQIKNELKNLIELSNVSTS